MSTADALLTAVYRVVEVLVLTLILQGLWRFYVDGCVDVVGETFPWCAARFIVVLRLFLFTVLRFNSVVPDCQLLARLRTVNVSVVVVCALLCLRSAVTNVGSVVFFVFIGGGHPASVMSALRSLEFSLE